MESMLRVQGLWPREAEAIVVAAAISGPRNLRNRWDNEISSAPPERVVRTWFMVKRVAVEWLEANEPKHGALARLRPALPENMTTPK